MNENFTNTELLIQYLDGELNESQEEAVKKSIEEDDSKREEFEKLRLAKEAIRSYGLKNKISSIHTEMMEELKKEAAPDKGILRKLTQYSMRIAAAALVVAVLSLSYQYFTATPEKLFNENFEAFNLHQTRGAAISLLEDAYKKENMMAVSQQFNTLKDPQTQDYLLAGNALLATNQPAKAIQAFMALQLQNKIGSTHYFEEDAEYYLALSYLVNKEAEKAIPLFEKINADKNHPYHKKISNWFLSKVRRFSAAK